MDPRRSGFSRFFPTGKYKRGVGVLVVGNAIAQLLLILAIPLLSRLYSPAEFGLLSLFTATTAIVGSVVCGRYQFAVALPKTVSYTHLTLPTIYSV